MNYTAGLLFHRRSVMLVRKNNPAWQQGLLNAVGGKIEPGETSALCMEREFTEEARLPGIPWRLFAVEEGPDYRVDFYTHRVPDDDPRPFPPVGNDRGEIMGWVEHEPLLADQLCWSDGTRMDVVGNLRWLVPLAMDWRFVVSRCVTAHRISERPTW
jgi:8-oxo-dGTP diphosphatase